MLSLAVRVRCRALFLHARANSSCVVLAESNHLNGAASASKTLSGQLVSCVTARMRCAQLFRPYVPCMRPAGECRVRPRAAPPRADCGTRTDDHGITRGRWAPARARGCGWGTHPGRQFRSEELLSSCMHNNAHADSECVPLHSVCVQSRTQYSNSDSVANSDVTVLVAQYSRESVGLVGAWRTIARRWPP